MKQNKRQRERRQKTQFKLKKRKEVSEEWTHALFFSLFKIGSFAPGTRVPGLGCAVWCVPFGSCFCVDFKLKGTKTNGNEREVRVLFPFNLNTTQKERNERVFLSLISLHAFTRSSFHCKRNEERNTLIQFPPLSCWLLVVVLCSVLLC